MKSIILRCATIALTALCAFGAQAQNLVYNGDFSQVVPDNIFAAPIGWTFVNAPSGSAIFVSTSALSIAGGLYNAVAFEGVGTEDDSLVQTIATKPGQDYNVSFYLYSDGLTPQDFSATFGNKSFVTVNLAGTTDFIQVNMPNIEAISSQTVLTFSGRNLPGTDLLALVSVTAVPEPATSALFFVGLGLVGWIASKRRFDLRR